MSSLGICGIGGTVHCLNGSPVKPSMHEQIGRWFVTVHIAFLPQCPGHGSLHSRFIHEKPALQSVSNTHEGPQNAIGFPK